MSLFLLRHGSTGADGRFIGSTDLALSSEGLLQVEQSRNLLLRIGISRVYCSPMRRCLQTMEILGESLTGEIVEDLREINFGSWEQLSYQEIVDDYPDLLEEWHRQPESFTFPAGEFLGDFHERIEHFWNGLHMQTNENVLVICHGGVIRNLICHILGLPFSNSMLFNVLPGKVAQLDIYSKGGILSGLNLPGN